MRTIARSLLLVGAAFCAAAAPNLSGTATGFIKFDAREARLVRAYARELPVAPEEGTKGPVIAVLLAPRELTEAELTDRLDAALLGTAGGIDSLRLEFVRENGNLRWNQFVLADAAGNGILATGPEPEADYRLLRIEVAQGRVSGSVRMRAPRATFAPDENDSATYFFEASFDAPLPAPARPTTSID